MIEEIIKSNEKDNEIRSLLLSQIANLVDSINSVISINATSDLIQNTSNLIFYLSSYKGILSSTPGEDYSNIKKVNSGLMYVILNVFSYTILKYILKYTENKKIDRKHEDFRRYLFEKYLNLEVLIKVLEEIGNIVLLLTGKQSNLIQLALNVYYTTDRTLEGRIISRDGYKLLGLMLALKNLITFVYTLKDLRMKYTSFDNDSVTRQLKLRYRSLNTKEAIEDKLISKNRQSDRNCLLCLDIRSNTSSTICGHLFCWECIVEYLQMNPKCPVCRSKCKVENIIHLVNYE